MNLLQYALTHPYDGTQDIKSYQDTTGDITTTLYIDMQNKGHVSLAVKKENIDMAQFTQTLSRLALPDCHFISKEEKIGYIIYRYQFDLSQPEKSEQPKLLKQKEEIQPYWKDVDADRCHICSRELTNPLSLKVKVGPYCRKKIEKTEGKTEKMWVEMSQKELEDIWTRYNTYDIKRNKKRKEEEVLKKAKEIRMRRAVARSFSESVIVDDIPLMRPPSEILENLLLKGLQPLESLAKSEEKPQPLFEAGASECKHCGKMTTDYWHYDGKTGKCQCRPCLRKNKGK